MSSEVYHWPLVGEFLNRSTELDRMERWWASADRQPLALIGRRRVGKSWLFRRFADGKVAVVLVAEQLPPGAQLNRFAELLEPLLGNQPDLPDVPTLIRVLFRAARSTKLLVAIDEFPWLLGPAGPEAARTLSSVQAVMEEERDSSMLKLLLCGSQVAQMEALFGENNPMHGRLQRLDVRSLPFEDATLFLPTDDPVDAFSRFAVSGGMPMYLAKLGRGTLRHAVCSEILDRDGPLWNEGRAIVEQELREPRVYFAILERLAGGAKELNEIAQSLRMDGAQVAKYLSTLVGLRLVSRTAPFGATPTSRSGHWQLDDPFLRFWFRFVFPFQSDLETGLTPNALFESEVGPALGQHIAPVFEDWCRGWLRAHRSQVATRIGAWWGNSANQHRRTRERSSEEIDAVGALRNRVTLVAECKWTAAKLTPSIIDDLDRYKIPALRQSGLKVAEHLQIVLFSKAGYSDSLHDQARLDDRIELVDVRAELQQAARRRPAG